MTYWLLLTALYTVFVLGNCAVLLVSSSTHLSSHFSELSGLLPYLDEDILLLDVNPVINIVDQLSLHLLSSSSLFIHGSLSTPELLQLSESLNLPTYLLSFVPSFSKRFSNTFSMVADFESSFRFLLSADPPENDYVLIPINNDWESTIRTNFQPIIFDLLIDYGLFFKFVDLTEERFDTPNSLIFNFENILKYSEVDGTSKFPNSSIVLNCFDIFRNKSSCFDLDLIGFTPSCHVIEFLDLLCIYRTNRSQIEGFTGDIYLRNGENVLSSPNLKLKFRPTRNSISQKFNKFFNIQINESPAKIICLIIIAFVTLLISLYTVSFFRDITLPPQRRTSQAIVMTDIESSTYLWEQLQGKYLNGDEIMKSVWTLHNTVVRTLVDQFHGRECFNEGDGFLLLFDNCCDAVSFAVSLQLSLVDEVDWPMELLQQHECSEVASEGRNVWKGLRVRVGIHFGKINYSRKTCGQSTLIGLLGKELGKCSAVTNAGHGGQILASSEVIADFKQSKRYPSPIRIDQLGVYNLQQADLPILLYQITPNSLIGRHFPPVRTQTMTRGSGPGGIASRRWSAAGIGVSDHDSKCLK
ncbi:hypothetical protein GEMRC1_006820 [Eukaryota sp. GEM-RC1]